MGKKKKKKGWIPFRMGGRISAEQVQELAMEIFGGQYYCVGDQKAGETHASSPPAR